MSTSGFLDLRRTHRSIGPTVVTMFLAATLAACTTTTVVYRPPADVLSAERGRWLELRTVSGERYIIRDGHVRNDTLFATRGVGDISDSTFAVPLRAVSSLTREGQQLSAGTSGVIGIVVGALVGVLVGIALATAPST